MSKLKKVSVNEIEESLQFLQETKNNLTNKYSHISEHLKDSLKKSLDNEIRRFQQEYDKRD